MASDILWQNAEKTIILIDIPRSIAAAQSTKEEPCTDFLLSVAALEAPFPAQECNNTRIVKSLASNAANDFLHQEYHILLQRALDEVRSCHKDGWCQERTFISSRGVRNAKRKASDIFAEAQSSELPTNILSNITQPCLTPPDVHFQGEDDIGDGDYEPGSHLWNHSGDASTMVLSHHELDTASSTDYEFRVPAGATFVLANCLNTEVFHNIVDQQGLKFDFILLDPPWPNRSVKRTHKTPGTSYATISTLQDISDLLLNMNISRLLSGTGHVGVWITNKAAIRTLVLGPGGLFEHWGVDLYEEWIWLKTTVHGEPVTPLEGMWNGKKPYEVLLIGKKKPVDTTASEEAKRRVMIAVPDLHSRKPCLKEKIQTLVGTNGNVLEVFARHLVAGWWSWGDECVKFNWEGYWQGGNVCGRTRQDNDMKSIEIGQARQPQSAGLI